MVPVVRMFPASSIVRSLIESSSIITSNYRQWLQQISSQPCKTRYSHIKINRYCELLSYVLHWACSILIIPHRWVSFHKNLLISWNAWVVSHMIIKLPSKLLKLFPQMKRSRDCLDSVCTIGQVLMNQQLKQNVLIAKLHYFIVYTKCQLILYNYTKLKSVSIACFVHVL